MAINIQKLVKAFKEFCYDLKGKLEEKYPSYTCKISRTSKDKIEKFYFNIRVHNRNTIPLEIAGYKYYIKNKKLKTQAVSFSYLLTISKSGDKEYKFISANSRTALRVHGDGEIKLYLNISGVAMGKRIKIYNYNYALDELPKLTLHDTNNILILESCKDKDEEVSCKYVRLNNFYFYTNKKIEELGLRPGYTLLYEHDKEYRELFTIAKDFEYIELYKIDKILSEYKGLLHFMKIYDALLKEIPEDIRKLSREGWSIVLYPSQSDITRYQDLPASGITDPNKKRIYIPIGDIVHYDELELTENLVHEIKHALLRIEGKSFEGYWEYEEGKFVPYGEEKEAVEYTKAIIKKIAKSLSK